MYYSRKLLEIHSQFDKLYRYEDYFEFLYDPSGKIPDDVAIEHHLESYLADFYILKERLCKILGELKNDLPKYEIQNVDQVKIALDHIVKNVEKFLKSVKELRRVHTHEKSVLDADIVRAKAMRVVASTGMPGLDVNKIESERKTAFERAKSKYLEQVRMNKEALEQLESFYFNRFGYIFSLINGHDAGEFDLGT